jgi:uncharacterized protein
MEFERHEAKAASNLVDHGVSFESAVTVFNDPQVLIVATIRERDGEARYKAIGLIQGRLYTVIHTMRDEIRRLISARPSNKAEERIYGNR